METQDRPHITLNFAMSADGKISTSSREPFRFSSKLDRNLMDDIRARSDAILYGAATIRAENPTVGIRSRKHREQRLAQGKPAHPMAIVITRSLDLPMTGSFFRPVSGARLVVTTEDADPVRVAMVSRTVEVVQFGTGEVDLAALCGYLKRGGIYRLLVEGGGAVNMAFFAHRMVDEVYLTLCPVIIGGQEAPTPVDGEGFSASDAVPLELIESRRTGHEVFQHYRVVHSL